jgi:hypothetical protein
MKFEFFLISLLFTFLYYHMMDRCASIEGLYGNDPTVIHCQKEFDKCRCLNKNNTDSDIKGTCADKLKKVPLQSDPTVWIIDKDGKNVHPETCGDMFDAIDRTDGPSSKQGDYTPALDQAVNDRMNRYPRDWFNANNCIWKGSFPLCKGECDNGRISINENKIGDGTQRKCWTGTRKLCLGNLEYGQPTN